MLKLFVRPLRGVERPSLAALDKVATMGSKEFVQHPITRRADVDRPASDKDDARLWGSLCAGAQAAGDADRPATHYNVVVRRIRWRARLKPWYRATN